MTTTWPVPRLPLRDLQTAIRRRLLGFVMSRGGGGGDVTSFDRFPESSTFPLRRDGVDPVPELTDAPPVGRLAKILGLRVWLVTGYDEAREVLADTERFSNDMRHLVAPRKRSDAETIGGLGMTDAPDHTRLRGLLTPEFTKRRLTRLQESIDSVVADALDDLERRGPEVDLVPHFAFAVPFRVISDLLGIPDADREAFRGLGVARFDMTGGGAGSFGAAARSREFLIEAVRRQRDAPGDGLIGAALTSRGDDLSDVELGGLMDGVFLGGYETSASMLAMGTYVLAREPEAYALLRSGDPARIDAVVEELLRYLCPVQAAFPRFARTDLELGGHRVRKGDVVVVSMSAANREAGRVPRPDEFSLDNEGTAHLAFGHGVHRCIGAELARMELRTALVALSTRFPDLTLTDTEPSFRPLSVVHGLESLEVRL